MYPPLNMRYAALYLKKQETRYVGNHIKDFRCAVSAYNAGSCSLNMYTGDVENESYIKKVKAIYNNDRRARVLRNYGNCPKTL